MSENKHTPEPWYVVDKPWGDGTWINSGSPDPHHEGFVADCEDMNGDVDKDTARINARRIVAAVNACAGIETEMLEMVVEEGRTVLQDIEELTKQRDDLLAALKKLTDVFANIGITSGLYDDEQDALKSACATIASVKELK